MKEIPTLIKSLRRDKGYTQGYMAARLHLSSRTYRKIENGVTRLDVERLAQIAEILEVKLIDLIPFKSLTDNLQGYISNKDPVPQDEIRQSERNILQLMIKAKG